MKKITVGFNNEQNWIEEVDEEVLELIERLVKDTDWDAVAREAEETDYLKEWYEKEKYLW